jgi:hypothetical protein
LGEAVDKSVGVALEKVDAGVDAFVTMYAVALNVIIVGLSPGAATLEAEDNFDAFTAQLSRLLVTFLA